MAHPRGRVAVTVVVASLLLGCGASAPPLNSKASPKAQADDLAAMEGTWVYEQQTVEGNGIPMMTMDKHHIVIKGNKCIRHAILPDGKGLPPSTSVLELDPSTTPKQMDDTMDVLMMKSRRVGIYKLEGGKLYFCYDNTGTKRPTTFDSPAGSSIVLTVLRRAE